MYSASVYKEDFLEVKRIIKGKSPRLERQLDRCNKLLLSMKRECGDWQLLEDVTGLAAGIMTAFSYMETFMEEFPEFPERETVLDFYFCLRDFLNVYEELDGHYRIYEENREDGSFLVRLFCVDPSRLLSRCMDQGASTILFSATLLPVRYYKTLLSGNQEDYAVYVNSPFPEENRLLMVAEDVSSRYTRRSPSEYRKVADYIRIVTESRPGNYMVFFPSYQYMGEIEEILEEEPLKADLLVQGQGMGEAEKTEFLEEFEKERSHSLAAFCVMGGVFSEGIDLKEERLIGVIVVGTGLPMVCVEQEVLKGYFDETEEKGFGFSYQYPGMNKVLQAAGRVIRTPGDRGVFRLLDDRFL